MNSITKKHERHGLDTKSPTYRSWIEMHRRCRRTGRAETKRYAERGIIVCERWQKYSNFYADMGERPNGTSLDRIDNSGNYELSNCRWATPKEQNNNRRTNHLVTISGRTQNIRQWCNEYGIPETTFHNRLKRGWRGDKLLLQSN